jgi:hypothetical protein
LRDGDESFFAGKRFYALTEHHADFLKAPLPLEEGIQDKLFHLSGA